MTFSIVAWDPEAHEWGVAVASKFLAAGSVVPWARAGAGAVATQAFANITYGPRGLALLGSKSADEVVADLINADEEREHRQVGIVDGAGEAAAFTGSECFDWAGSRGGDGYTCQGNILTGPDVVETMAAAFEAASGDLAGRLQAALAAGDRAGGDRRGKQSAAMLIAREGGGYLGDSDIALDLRVDDHPEPVEELGRLLGIHRLLFPNPDPARLHRDRRRTRPAPGSRPDRSRVCNGRDHLRRVAETGTVRLGGQREPGDALVGCAADRQYRARDPLRPMIPGR